MKINKFNGILCGSLLTFMLLSSCRSGTYQVSSIKADRITLDSVWDTKDQRAANELIAPYKQKVHEVMYTEMGRAAKAMDRFRPESPLSNLVAEVLRKAAVPYIGKEADMGLINIGGIRNSLAAGPITRANLFELLPFENSLCILKMNGVVLRHLCQDLCHRRGEGISGIRIKGSADHELISAEIDGKPIDDNKTYYVATVDYVAEGNDGMKSCTEASEKICPDGKTLRGLFIQYVEDETKAGRAISADVDGRMEFLK